MKVEKLGTFEVTSGKLIISDPCYETPTWCQGFLKNVKNGTWKAWVEKDNCGSWGERVMSLAAIHLDSRLEQLIQLDATIGVDSGQAGIFDAGHYRDLSVFVGDSDFYAGSTDHDDNQWYGHCCDVTLAEAQAGIIPYGAVASSGYGDGCYECLYSKDDNDEVVKVEIVFIPTEEKEDEE